MKKSILLFLTLALALCLAACGEKSPTSVSAFKSEGEYPKMAEQLTWERLNAQPIKTENMTSDEARALCVDFFRFAKTALWTPDEELAFTETAAEDAEFDNVERWGELKNGTYTVKILVQLGTGERPAVYEGTLTV